MSYCLNPACPAPTVQIADARFCSHCGTPLQLAQRYRATAPIGEGQFGQTFLAVGAAANTTIRRCVIRQVPIPTLDGPPLQAEPVRSRSHALRELSSHPQLPALLAWFTQQRHYYWVFELVEGTALEALGFALSLEQALQLLTATLPVLQALHTAGIHHGDLKPANLILTASPSAAGPLSPPRLVGVDFGRSYPAPQEAYRSDLQSLGRLCAYLMTPLPRPAWSSFEGQAAAPQDPKLQDSRLQAVLERLMAADDGGYDSAHTAAAAVAAIAQGREYESSFNEAPTLVPQGRAAEALPDEALSDGLEALTSDGPQWLCRHTLTGHDTWVRSVAVSADGQWIMSGSGDKTVKVWSTKTGALRHTLKGHSAWVRAVATHPNRPLVASASNDKLIHLWNLETGQQVQTLKGHTDWIRALCFLPGDRLASASQDKTILLWDLASGTVIRTLQGHQHWVLSLAQPDDSVLVSGSRDRTLRLWDLASGRCLRVLTGHRDEVTSLVYCPHTGHIISGSTDQTIRYWRGNTGDCSHTINCSARISSLAVSPSQKLLAAGRSDNSIGLWNVSDRRPAGQLVGHSNWVWSVSFAPSQPPRLVSGSWDGTVKIWCPADTAS